MELNNTTYQLNNSGSFGKIALLTGIAGIAVTFAGGYLEGDFMQFYFSYLTSFAFWITIALGGLFFTMLHHLTNSLWSIVIRRIAESIMISLPFFAVLFIPIALGIHDLYHWSHSDVVAADAVLQKKSGYLNITFFLIRSFILYFGIWSFLSWQLLKISREQDTGFKAQQVKTLRIISAPGMIAFALTLTFSSFDWLMSLDPHWFSTVFGVYVFSGSTLAFLAFITLVCIVLRKNGILQNTITIEHFHDLGRLLLTFTIFWAYIAFSQYFLIWYANIPEETIWFLKRWERAWQPISMIIAFAFIVPFTTLLLRKTKRSLGYMTFISIYILLYHFIDMYWIIMPILHEQSADLSWMDFTAFIGIGGLFLSYFWNRLSSGPLVPVQDPRLEESIAVEH